MQRYTILFLLCFLTFWQGCQSPTQTKKISLAGEWQFQMDPKDQGISERWYAQKLPETITLPGSMNSNGKGFDVGLDTKWTGNIIDSSFFKSAEYAPYREADNIKIPFWLQPLKHYQGAAWYRREVQIPADWQGKTIQLFLERPHWGNDCLDR